MGKKHASKKWESDKYNIVRAIKMTDLTNENYIPQFQ